MHMLLLWQLRCSLRQSLFKSVFDANISFSSLFCIYSLDFVLFQTTYPYHMLAGFLRFLNPFFRYCIYQVYGCGFSSPVIS